MRMMKIKKKVFEKEVLDVGIKIVILDICEVTPDGQNFVFDFSRMMWIMPSKINRIAGLEKQAVEADKKLVS